MSTQSILIVEDDIKIAHLLQVFLENNGYSTAHLNRGELVIQYIKQTSPDLILLDVMLPEKDGLTLCREIRQFSRIPIIMLSGLVEEVDRLVGLELGADDYIGKPFSSREVVARIKAVLRRVSSDPITPNKMVLDKIVLDIVTYQVHVVKQELKLTPTEFSLLHHFMTYPNQVFSRQTLIEQVQGYDFYGCERTVDSHVKNLRKKLVSMLPDKEIISTIYGIGYKLNYPFLQSSS
ncbi:response regulator [Candidatus Parabeggiatoa sp. HSG14]|uniref:response regulator n=1 Tax=Candidatus Parabeggiatoa sp. HSG14 TaxID=3055593 RepID=UPI0025A831F9|nr:response regulator [Thiotrichales bacterium HSG14]